MDKRKETIHSEIVRKLSNKEKVEVQNAMGATFDVIRADENNVWVSMFGVKGSVMFKAPYVNKNWRIL